MELLIYAGNGEISIDGSPEAIHSALNPHDNIDYGTTFSLRTSSGWTLAAICVSSVYLPPND